MLRGLTEVEKNLRSRGIPMLLLKGFPKDELPKAMKTYSVSHLVCDFSPLRIGRKWRDEVAKSSQAYVYEGWFSLSWDRSSRLCTTAVDAHNIVPLWEASEKQEHAARTIRKKIHNQIPSTINLGHLDFFEVGVANLFVEYLHEFPQLMDHSKRKGGNKWTPDIPEIDWDSTWDYVRQNVDQSVPELEWIKPGVRKNSSRTGSI